MAAPQLPDVLTQSIERCAGALGDTTRLKAEVQKLKATGEGVAHFASALFELELAREGDPESRKHLSHLAEVLLVFWRDGSGDTLARLHPAMQSLWLSVAPMLVQFESRQFDSALQRCWKHRSEPNLLLVHIDALQPEGNKRVEFARCVYHLELARQGVDRSRAEFAKRAGVLAEAYQDGDVANALIAHDAGLLHLWSELKPYLDEFFEGLEEAAARAQDSTKKVKMPVSPVPDHHQAKTELHPPLGEGRDVPSFRTLVNTGKPLSTPGPMRAVPPMGPSSMTSGSRNSLPQVGERPPRSSPPSQQKLAVHPPPPAPPPAAGNLTPPGGWVADNADADVIIEEMAPVSSSAVASVPPPPKIRSADASAGGIAPPPPPIDLTPPGAWRPPKTPSGEVELVDAIEVDVAEPKPPPPPPVTPAHGLAQVIADAEELEVEFEPDDGTLAFWEYTFAALQMAPGEGQQRARMLASESRADRKRLTTWLDGLNPHLNVPEARAFGSLVRLMLAAETKEKSLFGQANPRRKEALEQAFALLSPTPDAAGHAAVWFELDGAETQAALDRGLELLIPFLAFCARESLDPLKSETVQKYLAI
ncbi:MAG: hypothetical protein JNM17_17520 [Archangium sp.]|nr:hypothetical protein [Archangium sp.]